MFSMPKQHVPRKLCLFKVVYKRNKKEEKGDKSESNVLDYYKISKAYSRYVLLTLRATCTQGLHKFYLLPSVTKKLSHLIMQHNQISRNLSMTNIG